MEGKLRNMSDRKKKYFHQNVTYNVDRKAYALAEFSNTAIFPLNPLLTSLKLLKFFRLENHFFVILIRGWSKISM